MNAAGNNLLPAAYIITNTALNFKIFTSEFSRIGTLRPLRKFTDKATSRKYRCDELCAKLLIMEINFSQLKQKEVVSLTDGKNLGRVCDVTFLYPENKLLGFTVTGGRGFKFTRQDLFIPMPAVVKIGEDTILVKMGDKENCPPAGKENCPPKRPPCPPRNPCPPPCPPDRRSYEEYE